VSPSVTADRVPDGLVRGAVAVMTLVTDTPVRTVTPPPDLDELLALRRATDPRFAGPRHLDPGTAGGPRWAGAGARVTVALVVTLGIVVAFGLLGGGGAGGLDWLFVATGLLAVALWVTRPDGLPTGDLPTGGGAPTGDVAPDAPGAAPPG
jgi:hypothetical protein